VLDDAVDPARGDAVDVGLLDDRDQRLLGAPAWLEKAREVPQAGASAGFVLGLAAPFVTYDDDLVDIPFVRIMQSVGSCDRAFDASTWAYLAVYACTHLPEDDYQALMLEVRKPMPRPHSAAMEMVAAVLGSPVAGPMAAYAPAVLGYGLHPVVCGAPLLEDHQGRLLRLITPLWTTMAEGMEALMQKHFPAAST